MNIIDGIKISDMTYFSLEDAVSDSAQIPLAVVINSEKLNRRIPISEVKGYQGDRGYQGYQGESVTGSQGHQGYQGYQGESITGSQGYQGYQGYQGESVTGSQGHQGYQGPAGISQTFTITQNTRDFPMSNTLSTRLELFTVDTNSNAEYGISFDIYLYNYSSSSTVLRVVGIYDGHSDEYGGKGQYKFTRISGYTPSAWINQLGIYESVNGTVVSYLLNISGGVYTSNTIKLGVFNCNIINAVSATMSTSIYDDSGSAFAVNDYAWLS